MLSWLHGSPSLATRKISCYISFKLYVTNLGRSIYYTVTLGNEYEVLCFEDFLDTVTVVKVSFCG